VALTTLSQILPPHNHLALFLPDPDGDVRGVFQGDPNVVYQLWGANDIPNWTLVQTVTAGPTGLVSFGESGVGGMPRRFYQIRLAPVN
jgi:hypothetical protein